MSNVPLCHWKPTGHQLVEHESGWRFSKAVPQEGCSAAWFLVVMCLHLEGVTLRSREA